MGNNVLLPVWLPELHASLWTTWSDKLSHKQSHRGYIKSIGFQRDNNELVWDLVIIDDYQIDFTHQTRDHISKSHATTRML